MAFATKIVNNIREVQSGVAIGVGERGRGRSFPLTRAVRSSGSTSWPSASSFPITSSFWTNRCPPGVNQVFTASGNSMLNALLQDKCGDGGIACRAQARRVLAQGYHGLDPGATASPAGSPVSTRFFSILVVEVVVVSGEKAFES